jgi:hypothetical protein
MSQRNEKGPTQCGTLLAGSVGEGRRHFDPVTDNAGQISFGNGGSIMSHHQTSKGTGAVSGTRHEPQLWISLSLQNGNLKVGIWSDSQTFIHNCEKPADPLPLLLQHYRSKFDDRRSTALTAGGNQPWMVRLVVDG